MKLEYYKGMLLVNIYCLNKKTYYKFNYISNIIIKYDIKTIIICLNNIKSNSSLYEILLSMNELISDKGGILYLDKINISDISLFNGCIKLLHHK